MSITEILGAIVFFGLGSFLFFFGFKKMVYLRKLKMEGLSATGEIIDLMQENLSFTPVIKFTNHKNQLIEGIAKNSISVKYFSFHKVGDRVRVYYDSSDTTHFVVDQFSEKVSSLFFILGGLVFTLASIYEIVRKFLLY